MLASLTLDRWMRAVVEALAWMAEIFGEAGGARLRA
jgi:hypothetical protein